MPQRPRRKKAPAPAQAASPQDEQARTDRRTAEQLRERTVRNLLGKFQGRKSIRRSARARVASGNADHVEGFPHRGILRFPTVATLFADQLLAER